MLIIKNKISREKARSHRKERIRSVDTSQSNHAVLCYHSTVSCTRTSSCLESKDQVESVCFAPPASSSLQDSLPNQHRHLVLDRHPDGHSKRVQALTRLWYSERRHGRDSRSALGFRPMKSRFQRKAPDRQSVGIFLKTVDQWLSTLRLHSCLE